MSLGASCPFQLSVVNDEISQDFGHACEVASKRLQLRWIELRSMWGKNVLALDSAEIYEVQHLVRRHGLRVTSIASPLFKVDWPEAPVSQTNAHRDQFGAAFTYAQQDEVLERGIALARAFGTDRLRCFDFWRLDDPRPHRAAMNAALQSAAEKAGKKGVTLVLENEHACNTATAAEAGQVLAAVRSPSFMLNWDPGNASRLGEVPFPDGYALLPKNRIGLCHCKDVRKTADDYEWASVGEGLIDWVGQFRALMQDGYRGAISLETHWRGAGSAEASTMQSWDGMTQALHKAGVI